MATLTLAAKVIWRCSRQQEVRVADQSSQSGHGTGELSFLQGSLARPCSIRNVQIWSESKDNFLAFVRVNDTTTFPTADILDPYLVRRPSSSEKGCSQDGRFCVFTFQVCARTARTNLHFIDRATLVREIQQIRDNIAQQRHANIGTSASEGYDGFLIVKLPKEK